MTTPTLSQLALYQYDYCGFCARVRRTLDELGLNIEIRDVLQQPSHRQELIRGGGRATVPCLRIDHADGRTEWMYESADIARWLRRHYGSPATQNG